MGKDAGLRFVMGIAGGVILGAVIDNMAIGLIVGFVVALGLLKWPSR